MLYRGTYTEINLDAFIYNIEALKKHTAKDIFCVCKANGYAHGDYHIAQTAWEQGCAYVCISSYDEALSLRKQNFEGNILILGYVDHESIEDIIDLNITISVFSLTWVEKLLTMPYDITNLKVHLKIDTGMNRIGFKKIDDIKKTMELLKQSNIEVEGIYTHFHSADDISKSACDKQATWFYGVIDALGHDFKWIHTSNSDASLSYKDVRSNASRIGLALYGIKSVDSPLDLKPVLSLYSTISHIKEVNKGETISYGATYECYKDSIIATLPIGYGDGFLRANQGRFVSIDSHPYEIVGRICMDQTMILVDEMYPIGTVVEIIGEHTPLVKMAKELDMSAYEVLCILSDRITKIVVKDNETKAVINNRITKVVS